MTTYTFTPNPPNPNKVNAMLGSTKVVEVQTPFNFPPLVLVTSSPLTELELMAIRNKLDKIYIFGYTESAK